MFARIIDGSIRNRPLIIVGALAVVVAGVFSLSRTPIDAIPDLSDVQVIIQTEYPGQAPRIVEDQVTYPVATQMLAAPFAQVVRGYSFFGVSFVYVIFEEGTDLYWARSRVLEYLNSLSEELPPGITPRLGPDATGVGWAFVYALRSDRHDLGELRSIQDWFLRYELTAVPGVSEVASVGGFVRQYQITVDPNRLRAYDLSISAIRSAIQASNSDVGGGLIEVAEREFMIRGLGYIRSVDDIRRIGLGVSADGTPILLEDVARVSVGPEGRRGLAEWNGEGETVGGIVVVRSGADTRQVIRDVKEKLAEITPGLPEGVEIEVAYDRSALIDRAVGSIRMSLAQQLVIVGLVCLVFLFHLRSGLVAVISLPVGILMALIVVRMQGLTLNIMSLGGIAVAIGTMVDAGIVMVENAHRHLARDGGRRPHWEIVASAAREVGPSLFVALLVITVSFMPVFTLEAQEGRLFKPLAFTKTYAMASAALLSVTLIPVLVGYWVRGRIRRPSSTPLGRQLGRTYWPVLGFVLRFRGWVLAAAVLGLTATIVPLSRLGSEFMPPLWEGDLLYMPTTLPGVSITEAREILQQTDRIIYTFPEVQHVFGKVGRAETATDPAPLSMLETTIALRPRDQWRQGMTPERLIEELDAALQHSGADQRLDHAHPEPDRHALDRNPHARRHQDRRSRSVRAGEAGARGRGGAARRSRDRQRVRGPGDGRQLPRLLHRPRGDRAPRAHRERRTGGDPDGHRRDERDDDGRRPHALSGQPALQPGTAGRSARAARRPGDDAPGSPGAAGTAGRHGIRGRSPEHQERGRQAQRVGVRRPARRRHRWLRGGRTGGGGGRGGAADRDTRIAWSGQYEYLERAERRLMYVIPLTLLLIFVLIYLANRSAAETCLVLLGVPFAVAGSFWLLYILGYDLSIAVWIGIIALAGLYAETAIVFLLYLNISLRDYRDRGLLRDRTALAHAIRSGSIKRVRPIMMTIATDVLGLMPIMWSAGAGADVMKRIAAPLVGGVVTSGAVVLLLFPVVYYLWKARELPEGPGSTLSLSG